MNGKSRKDDAALLAIDYKRSKLLEEAKKYGMESKEVLKRSEELDQLIINYMKKDS